MEDIISYDARARISNSVHSLLLSFDQVDQFIMFSPLWLSIMIEPEKILMKIKWLQRFSNNDNCVIDCLYG